MPGAVRAYNAVAMHQFQHQHSTQTLREGLAEYFAAYPGLASVRDMSPTARAFFEAHDAAHVVFGCDTTLDQEAAVKLASIFGSTAGWQVLRGYRLHESTAIYRKLRPAEVAATIVAAVVIVPRTLRACRAQRERWPWERHREFQHIRLDALRAQFGIRVLARGSASYNLTDVR
jgi:hypothetical protein